jgi:uncharacterized protein
LLLVVCCFVISSFIVSDYEFNIQPKFLFSDNKSIISISLKSKNIYGFTTPFIKPKLSLEFIRGNDKVDILPVEKNLLRLKAKNSSGDLEFMIKTGSGDEIAKVSLPIYSLILDSDHDGFPDVLELTDEQDRYNFRKWFVMIALTQYYHIDDSWVDRDCAGLIRFCFRETLKKHDNNWLNKKRFLYDINLPDIKKYNYPDLPLVKDRIFRTNSNIFIDSDLNISDSVFVSFVEAKYLKDCDLFFCPKIFRMQSRVT